MNTVSPRTADGRPTPVAVIDIGATSIRMAIGEIDRQRSVHVLETLIQAVNLGKDTFTRGSLSRGAIEECVRVLRSYRRKLQEYQILRPEQIRVVATSAVREAANRLAFLDRVYIGAGLQVEAIDEAEVNRITYLGVQPLLKLEPVRSAARTVVAEVGGGSTEILVLSGTNVVFSHTWRLGSLRLRKTLEAYHAPTVEVRNIMETQIRRTVEQIRRRVAMHDGAPLPGAAPGGAPATGGVGTGGPSTAPPSASSTASPLASSTTPPTGSSTAPPAGSSTASPLAAAGGQDGGIELIALGGDMRFAAAQLASDPNPEGLTAIPFARLERFTESVLSMSVDQIVRKHHLSFPDAETAGPALLAYTELARALNLKQVFVCYATLRDGLLKEMALQEAWSGDFGQQIVRSAIDLGRKFNFDEAHALHVAELSKQLFTALKNEHQLDGRYELLLYLAALLHEIGLFVSQRSYHKHTMYLIRHSDLFGLGKRDLLLVSLVGRYHRRRSPQPTHEGYATLDREQRVAVAKMAAILRVAAALDDSRSQRIKRLYCDREDGRLVITIPHVEDLTLEQLALRQNGALFEETFGMPVLLRKLRA